MGKMQCQLAKRCQPSGKSMVSLGSTTSTQWQNGTSKYHLGCTCISHACGQLDKRADDCLAETSFLTSATTILSMCLTCVSLHACVSGHTILGKIPHCDPLSRAQSLAVTDKKDSCRYGPVVLESFANRRLEGSACSLACMRKQSMLGFAVLVIRALHIAPLNV